MTEKELAVFLINEKMQEKEELSIKKIINNF